MTKLSNIFAYLPNGIIREIISYTCITHKKRNGKYIGQIPKNDIRYVLLLTIPKKLIILTNFSPTRLYFCSSVLLTHINDDLDRFDIFPHVYLDVHGIKYTNDSYFGDGEIIEYKLLIGDWKGNIRNEQFEYYRSDSKIIEIEKQTEKTLLLNKNIYQYIKNIFISNVCLWFEWLFIKQNLK